MPGAAVTVIWANCSSTSLQSEKGDIVQARAVTYEIEVTFELAINSNRYAKWERLIIIR